MLLNCSPNGVICCAQVSEFLWALFLPIYKMRIPMPNLLCCCENMNCQVRGRITREVSVASEPDDRALNPTPQARVCVSTWSMSNLKWEKVFCASQLQGFQFTGLLLWACVKATHSGTEYMVGQSCSHMVTNSDRAKGTGFHCFKDMPPMASLPSNRAHLLQMHRRQAS